MMYGRMPAGVSALVVEGTWGSQAVPRRVGTFVHNGTQLRAGVLSYVLAREIPFARDLRDLAYRVGKYKDSGSMAAIWADLPRAEVIGSGRVWPNQRPTVRK
jgi:hypothetical protein